MPNLGMMAGRMMPGGGVQGGGFVNDVWTPNGGGFNGGFGPVQQGSEGNPLLGKPPVAPPGIRPPVRPPMPGGPTFGGYGISQLMGNPSLASQLGAHGMAGFNAYQAQHPAVQPPPPPGGQPPVQQGSVGGNPVWDAYVASETAAGRMPSDEGYAAFVAATQGSGGAQQAPWIAAGSGAFIPPQPGPPSPADQLPTMEDQLPQGAAPPQPQLQTRPAVNPGVQSRPPAGQQTRPQVRPGNSIGGVGGVMPNPQKPAGLPSSTTGSYGKPVAEPGGGNKVSPGALSKPPSNPNSIRPSAKPKPQTKPVNRSRY